MNIDELIYRTSIPSVSHPSPFPEYLLHHQIHKKLTELDFRLHESVSKWSQEKSEKFPTFAVRNDHEIVGVVRCATGLGVDEVDKSEVRAGFGVLHLT